LHILYSKILYIICIFRNLIASGSEDEDEPTKNHDTLKILFETAGIDHSRTESGEDDMDLQIDWEPALDEMEVQPKRKIKDDEATLFQQYLEMRKIKKKGYKAKIQGYNIPVVLLYVVNIQK
jgi:hypothetical protein